MNYTRCAPRWKFTFHLGQALREMGKTRALYRTAADSRILRTTESGWTKRRWKRIERTDFFFHGTRTNPRTRGSTFSCVARGPERITGHVPPTSLIFPSPSSRQCPLFENDSTIRYVFRTCFDRYGESHLPIELIARCADRSIFIPSISSFFLFFFLIFPSKSERGTPLSSP